MREDGAGDAGEHEAPQHRHGEDIFGDLFVPRTVGETKDDVLNLVIDAAAGLEGFGLRCSGEVVQVGLEEPEGLYSGVFSWWGSR